MANGSAAMELRVLINILSQGTALKTLLSQTEELSKALADLQKQAAGPEEAAAEGAKEAAKGAEELAREANNATYGAVALDNALRRLTNGLRFLAGGFLALQSVRFVKDLADTAARAQVLSTVLHVVGNNAGYATDKLDDADRKIQSLGISASAARQSLVQFIQAGLNLADAPLLARAAQDAAVILGTNSSDAFERLVTAVQRSNSLMLRHMGIVISIDGAYQRFAASINKSVTQLTSAQRAQAVLNETLVKTRNIQGSYTAAMGDVGKQLTSLSRLTEDLKTSLGNNLLPAYLAIVEELTLFLQQVGLAADEMYGQGQGAKKLGEDIRMLAQAFFAIAKFLVEYRKEIGILIVTYAGIAKVLVPLATQLVNLTTIIKTGSGEGALGLLVKRLGWARLGLIGLAIALIELMMIFDPVNAAVGSLVGWLWYLIEVARLVQNIIIGGLIAAVKSLFNLIANPLSPETWIKPWKNWADGVIEQIKRIGNVWELTKERFKQIFAGPDITPEGQAILDRKARFDAEAGLLVAIKVATSAYNELKQTGSREQIAEADKELKVMKEKQAALTKQRKDEQATLGMNQGMKDAEEDRLQKKIQELEKENTVSQLEKIREKAKFWYLDEGEVSKPFMESMGQFVDLLDIFNKNSNEAGIKVAELGTNFVEATGIAKTKGDLAGVNKAMKDLVDSPSFKKLSQEDQRNLLSRARAGVRTAELNVAAEIRRETAEIERVREQHFREMEKRRADHLSNEAAMMKSAFGIQEAMDQQAYSRRGMDLDKFYDRKRARLKEETDQEIIEAKNALAAVEREAIENIPKTQTEREALETKRIAAQKALNLLQGESGTIAARFATLGIEQEDARAEKMARSKQTLLDLTAVYGELDAALAAVNFKFDEQFNKANLPQEREAIRAEQQRAIFETELKYRERLLQIGLIEEKQKQELLDLTQAQFDIARDHIAAEEKAGNITEIEAIRARNALVRLQAAKDEEMIASKTVELRKLELALTEEEAFIRADMVGKTAEAIELRLRTDLADRRLAIQGLQIEIDKLKQSVKDSAVELESYGKKLQEVFKNSLTQMLVDISMFNGKLVDALTNFGKALQRQVLTSVFTNFAGKITESLAKVGKGGVFENVFKFFGIGAKPDGSTKDKALWVNVSNFDAMAFGGKAPTNIGTNNISVPSLTGGGQTGIGQRGFTRGLNFNGGYVAAAVSFIDSLVGALSRPNIPTISPFGLNAFSFAEGGAVTGPGTGTSDSVPALLSAGEHVMPASKAAQWMPVLEGIRTGRILPFADGGIVQSVAIGSVIPRRYASGGTVVTDGGASSVQTGGGGGNMVVSLHPDTLNMSMREWLEHEVVRQQGRR